MSTSLAPVSKHDSRATFLDSLATLLGCSEVLPGLPDGSRPDVLSISPQQKMLFLGDAKDTETPRNTETQVRLMGYIRWLETWARREEGPGMFAICFGNSDHDSGWQDTVLSLASEVGLRFRAYDVEPFDSSTRVAWFEF